MRQPGRLLRGMCALAATAAPAQTASPPSPAPTFTPGPRPAANASAAFPTGADTPLGAQIHALLSDPAVARAHWGVAVTTLDGTPVFGLDEAKLFRPASTAKLFTTAAALALLGPDTRFTTNVYGALDAATGTVKGDLVLVGAGDPSLGTLDLINPATADAAPSDLQDLATQLAAKGVRRIAGNIVGDDDLFQREPPPEGWAAEDLVWGYGALPSSLSFADNQLRLTIQPQPAKAAVAPGSPAQVTVDQPIPYLRIANNVLTEEGPPDHIDVRPLPGRSRVLNLLGSISPKAGPVTLHVSLDDPSQYAAEALRATLGAQGIRVNGHATAWHNTTVAPEPFLATLHAPEDCETSTVHGALCSLDCLAYPHSHQLLAQHTSAPLSADVQFTLATSANLHAEIFLRQLAAKNTCAGATSLSGARLLRAWLLQAGLPPDEFLFYDGSGLSTKDLVTPRAEAQLLAYAATQPWFASWKAGFPVGGSKGTLAHRFTAPPLLENVIAKTGTLGESRALAGFVHASSGRELIFAILVDDHDPGTSADRSAMDKLVELIAANN